MSQKIRGRVLMSDLNGGSKGLMDLTDTSVTLTKNHVNKFVRITNVNKFVRITNASAIAVTIPAGLPMQDNEWIQFVQGGAGAITVTGASGVTVNAVDQGTKESGGVSTSLHLRKVGPDEYLLL
jgi:uncharacterized protein YjiK